MNMSFVCLSHKQLVSNNGQEELEEDAKAKYSEEVQKALNAIEAGNADKLVLCLQGGGIAARGVGRCPEMAVEGAYIAVLNGNLQNYAYLVRKYCLEELSLPSQISLESIRELTPVREAALLCKLYERLGTGLLTKLRGKFAFCLFDSRSLRVLAARDCSGAVPLVSGETDDGFVFVASGDNLPPKANNVMKIEPGKYIYGWFSPQTKYANPQDVVEKSAAEALVAAAAALKGITLNLDSHQPGRGRSSSDASNSPYVKRRASSSDPPPYTSHARQQLNNNRAMVPDYGVWRPGPTAATAPYQQQPPIQHLPQHHHLVPPQHFPHHPHHPPPPHHHPHHPHHDFYSYPPHYYQAPGFLPRESRRMSDPYQPRIRRTSLDPNWKPAEEPGHISSNQQVQTQQQHQQQNQTSQRNNNSNYNGERRTTSSTGNGNGTGVIYSQERMPGRTGFKLKRNKHQQRSTEQHSKQENVGYMENGYEHHHHHHHHHHHQDEIDSSNNDGGSSSSNREDQQQLTSAVH